MIYQKIHDEICLLKSINSDESLFLNDSSKIRDEIYLLNPINIDESLFLND
jgi:hypothetical protein